MNPPSHLPMHDNGNYSLGVRKTLGFLLIGLAVTCSMVLIGLKVGDVAVPKAPPVDVTQNEHSKLEVIENPKSTPPSQFLDLMRSQIDQSETKTLFNHFKLPLQIEPSPIILPYQKDVKPVQKARK